MALSFIKKVFTFGKDKPVEASAHVPDGLPKLRKRAIEAELEPHSREEHLPLASDPVLPEEMDTAGGPAADVGDSAGVRGRELPPRTRSQHVLPAADQIGDMGLVPLSLLEAEAEASAAKDTPPALPGVPPTGGETRAVGCSPPSDGCRGDERRCCSMIPSMRRKTLPRVSPHLWGRCPAG